MQRTFYIKAMFDKVLLFRKTDMTLDLTAEENLPRRVNFSISTYICYIY